MSSRRPMNPSAHRVALACRGFLHDAEGLRLYELARDHARLGPIVEVGSYCGKSSVYLGDGAKAGGGTLVCLDHHRGSEEHQPGEGFHDPELFDAAVGRMDSLPALRRTIHDAGLEDSVILMVATSPAAARVWSTPLAMVFIDGGHSFEAAENDYASWAHKVAPGGILAIHDLFPDPADGGQAPITIYRRALASRDFVELPTTKTLGVLRRRAP
jgi:MMP 1-O-methyltransferase